MNTEEPQAMSFRIANAQEFGGPDKRHIEATLCTPGDGWVTIIFDAELALRAAGLLTALAAEL